MVRTLPQQQKMQMCCIPLSSQNDNSRENERKESKRIDREIRKVDRKKFEAEIKILLLGAGESGKSTIAKQMKIIHRTGFSEVERLGYKATIFHNIVSSMKILINKCSEFGLEVKDKDAADRILKLPEITKVLIKETANDVTNLWNDNAIQQTFKRSSEFYLMDNISHYFSNVERIAAEGYLPIEQDILNSRATTTGIHETEFDMGDAHFKMVDVGGQRTERKKWIHCFEGVTAVLFCVSMSEYDQKLLEDEETPRMHESLSLFKEVCMTPWFADTAMILFLNKKDLFAEKLTRVPLSVCFPEYSGENEYQAASKYVQEKFVKLIDNTKPIYPHFTCATDTGHIAVVFQAVRDIVLRAQLVRNGMM